MNRILYIIVIFALTTSCKAQQVIEANKAIFDKIEPGRCLFALCLEDGKEGLTTYKDAFIFTIEEPKYHTGKLNINDEDAQKFILEEKEDTYRILYRPGHVKFTFYQKDLNDFFPKHINEYAYCLIEVPPSYNTISKKQLEENNWEFEVIEISENSKLIRKSVKKKPKKLKENELYLPEGYWTEERELIFPTNCPAFTLRQLEERLIELGYKNIIANNILEEPEKEAIIDFQKKNNIKVENSLTPETIRKMGIPY